MSAIIESIRETLESALPRVEAATLLFGALARWGARIPADQRELASFVHGPLAQELKPRLEAATLARLLGALDALLEAAGAPTADHEIPIDVEEPVQWRDEVSTKLVRAIDGPVPVLFIAASSALALRLRLALGEAAIDVEARADPARVERALETGPVLAVVDATDPASISVDRLADALAHATDTSTIVWGSERPYGQRLMAAADARGVQFGGLATSEGVGAIFDLVVARRI